MPATNSLSNDSRTNDQSSSPLSYSPSLEAAMQLILADPTFLSDTETSSLKFIRAARFLKINAPHVFHVREMLPSAMNTMDRWLWDFIG
jgi:hypothetical protein